MSKFDFDAIVALWSEADADDRAAILGLAQKARRQARLIGYLDGALAVLIVGLGLFTAFTKPSPMGLVAVVLAIAMTIWITWKRRQFRQMSRSLDTSDRRAFLESSIRSAKANLRRATLSLAMFVPFVLAGLLYKVSTRSDPEFDRPMEVLVAWATSARGVFALTLVALLAAWTIRSRRRAKAELRRLREVRDAYEDEARSGETADA